MSWDGVRTCSPSAQEPGFWNAKSKGFFGQTAQGVHVYVYNEGPANSAPTGRTSLRYKTKPAGGAWSAARTFYDADIKNSYPTLIDVSPGNLRAVWDGGTRDRIRTHIHFGKFGVKADRK